MEGRFFTSTEAAEITQCSRRQLQYWREQEIVVPTVNTTGKGRNVYYSVTDLLALTLMEYLLSVGLSFEVCQSALNFLRAVDPKLFELPLHGKTEKRFMLWQSAGEETLRCTEFDEQKAITAIQAGRAIVPIQIEALGKRPEKRLQLVSSPS
ncbi:MerR family transcriptional regulator [Stenomitos frigidus]|uniref:MerR family transcriptional regulator n=1 Tax=Stenomitos frigidus ULC18 TaxID=2107698 RepID=A0A2T1EM00_9CYAN|nr:MerR family transcriptional regulator [Stenomitos frigidus]PSB33756.1 MerR family transcriptional regulator [Stenomitos frigidus ULC18]